MDAIVTAGGIPEPEDLLYEYTQGGSKAMLDMAGKPMIQWVLDALCESKTIERVVIVGLEPGSNVTCPKSLAFIPNQGSMVDNIRKGVSKVLELNPGAEFALMVSSDIPGINGEMVDWSVNTALETDDDAYYSVVTRELMESRFPGSKRSYIRFKDVEVCGADMNMIRTSIATGRDEFWNKLVAARKNAFKQAALIGYDTLFLLLLRQLTINGVVKKASARLGLKGRAIISPYAEIAMDVDKPYQLELLRKDLARKN
jgi:GTP:adenosylcobinamide-phosphate guanylyltransferase